MMNITFSVFPLDIKSSMSVTSMSDNDAWDELW